MDIADKIRKIEALIAGTKSDGERQAAEFAKQRLQEKIVAQPHEYTVRVESPWKKSFLWPFAANMDFELIDTCGKNIPQ